MPYILRSRNALDLAAVNFNPESVFAWNVQPDESLAPAASWEFCEQEDLETILAAAPALNALQEAPSSLEEPLPVPEEVSPVPVLEEAPIQQEGIENV